MKRWAWFNVLLKVLDLGTTYYFVNIHGTVVERNPIVRAVFDRVGLDWGCVAVMAICGLMVYALYRCNASIAMRIIAALMALVVINNFYHIFTGG